MPVGENSSDQPDGINRDNAIFLGRKIVRLDDGIVQRVCTARADIATTFGALLTEAQGQPREVIKQARDALHVASRREHHLDVGHVQFFARLPEAVSDRGRYRERTGPTETPAYDLAHQFETLGALVERFDTFDARD